MGVKESLGKAIMDKRIWLAKYLKKVHGDYMLLFKEAPKVVNKPFLKKESFTKRGRKNGRRYSNK